MVLSCRSSEIQLAILGPKGRVWSHNVKLVNLTALCSQKKEKV